MNNLKSILSHIDAIFLNLKEFLFLFLFFLFELQMFKSVIFTEKGGKASCIFTKGKMNN